tara:strand:- start:15545 stop:16285 length:741 start_codon:yes stop_codon:yes gene_type:complete
MEDEAVKGFLTVTLLLSLGSCAWLQKRQSLFESTDETKAKAAEATTVPKHQYDQLLQKYEALQTRYQSDEAQVVSEAMPAALDEAPTGANDQAILGALQNANSGELAETVDVFAGAASAATTASSTMVGSDDYSSVDVEAQIRNLQTAEQLVEKNRFDESLNLLKPLERSPVRQVRVRARYLVGESLFRQGDFDLSMQIFEEIIQKEAFSGMVLKALGRLIVCAEKLKLEKKKERYYSLLHDFFEA